MNSEESPAHKRKWLDPGNEGGSQRLAPKSPLLSSPRFEHLEERQDGQNDQQLASPTPDTFIVDPNQSTSERARERFLKEDPLALVLGPSSVECRQCRRKIKLSSKSAYDPFHWRNHRTRCMKAQKKQKNYLTPPLSSRLSPLHEDSLIYTSPLISDCDDDRVSDRSGERAKSPTPSSSFIPPRQAFSVAYSSLDTMFDDYLRRSHPDYAQPAASVRSTGRWRNWSWSQLKQPLFPVDDDGNYDDDMDEDPPPSFGMPSGIFRRAATASLSFVS